MQKYDVTIHVEVQADSAANAFLQVRKYYIILHSFDGVVSGQIGFTVDLKPKKLKENESIF